jgi:Pro-kumamolisin, activation domain/Viral BACON domain
MTRSFLKCVEAQRRFFAVFQLGFARKVQAQAIIAATFVLAILFAPASGAAQLQVLSGHVPKITKGLSPIGRLDNDRRLELSIGLPLRNLEELTNLLEDIYNPASPNYRHFLTPDRFASSFGPSSEDYQKVIDFAKSHGLVIKGTHPNRTLLDVSGSVGDIEKAFHVHMLVYQHPVEARTFFAPDVEPSLDLDTPVLMINGLDNYVKPRPRLHASVMPMPRTIGVQPLRGGGGGGGSGGGNTGPFEGSDYRNAYAAGVSQDGTGQSVGLFELFAFSQQDIQDYEDENGISYVTVQPILIDGASGDDSDEDYFDDEGYLDYAFEVTGDIEMAISMAPGLSSVLVYEGPTPQDEPPLGTNYVQDASTTAQINDVLNRMATDNLAKQLSCSYGMDINLSTVQIFQQFAAQGQSFFLASGDGGAYSSVVDEPADDPYITVVGGTSLTTTSTGSWASETTWSSPASNDGMGDITPAAASGGGVSLTYAIPTWQQGISMTANQGSATMRNIPDVSLVANNMNIVWGNDVIGASSDWTEEGTSLATPLWAGFIALVNQQAAANGQSPIGFANPALYAIGKSTNYLSCFNDINTGCNTNSSSPTMYFATAGYDLCTGWGTMIGGNLMQALLAPPTEHLVVTSPLGFMSFGPGGGPFTVTSQTYTLKNAGSTSLNWSIANTPNWLTVSSTSGSLGGGASATVTISLNSAATNFLIGNYSGNVLIYNQTDGTFQNRQFNLYVGNGGFETGDFTDWTMVGGTDFNFALASDDADVAGEEALPGEPDGLFVHSGLYGAYLGQSPGNGSLSQTVTTTASGQYLVSFWLTCIPYQDETTPNGFDAKWNDSTFFTATNLPAFGWTNMQYLVTSAGTSGTLEFDFNNTPGAFGLDDVTVQTVPGPVLGSTTVSHGNLTLGWDAIANASYQIQSTTNLGNSGWINVGSPIPATNSVLNVSLPMGSSSKQFYRVLMSQ